MTQKKYIPFKVRYDFEDRTAKFAKFSQGGIEGNIALIIEPLGNSSLGHFENCRFAIDRAKTINYFRAMLQVKLGLDDTTSSIYLFNGKKLLHDGGMQIGELYDRYKDEDGFLYISYAENNPF
jgi:hypothetical protein